MKHTIPNFSKSLRCLVLGIVSILVLSAVVIAACNQTIRWGYCAWATNHQPDDSTCPDCPDYWDCTWIYDDECVPGENMDACLDLTQLVVCTSYRYLYPRCNDNPPTCGQRTKITDEFNATSCEKIVSWSFCQ